MDAVTETVQSRRGRKMLDKAGIIRSSVTLRDILNAYGYNGDDRRGRMSCPIHGGDNKGQLHFTDHVFYCFTCGASGDAIDFVQQHDDLKFVEAVDKINDWFHLWGKEETLTYEMKKKIAESEIKRKTEKAKKEKQIQEQTKARDEYLEADSNLIRYAPSSPDEELSEEFVKACHDISYKRYLLDAS